MRHALRLRAWAVGFFRSEEFTDDFPEYEDVIGADEVRSLLFTVKWEVAIGQRLGEKLSWL